MKSCLGKRNAKGVVTQQTKARLRIYTTFSLICFSYVIILLLKYKQIFPTFLYPFNGEKLLVEVVFNSRHIERFFFLMWNLKDTAEYFYIIKISYISECLYIYISSGPWLLQSPSFTCLGHQIRNISGSVFGFPCWNKNSFWSGDLVGFLLL